MSRVQNKASRLSQIEALLLANPEGMPQAELARRLEVDRSTINRDIADLPKHIYIDDLDGGRLKLDKEAYLVNVRLNLHEVLAVHLAARLLATRMDRQNKHAAGAMRKLGIALKPLTAQIGNHILQSADVLDDPNRRQDPIYIGVLEKLTVAWAEQRKVQIWHRHENGKVLEYTFSPYFIEPYAVGQSTHVIGWRQPPGAMRTFKIERIERVELLRETYTIPEAFDPRDLLADAWGVWYTDRDPVEVVLKFGTQAARRVQETRWHRSEQITIQEDGSLLWRAKVAEPLEMLPWIRGWGADVEVLEPAGLRESLRRETRKMAEIYKVVPPIEIPAYFSLWAKSEKSSEPDTHSLIYHLMDVGECALALWSTVLSEQTKQTFAQWLNLDVDTTGRQLAFWASLHDLGKASPAFQRKYPSILTHLKAAGFSFGEESSHPTPHGIITAWALRDLLCQETVMKKSDASQIAIALGGHHGVWPTNDNFLPTSLKSWDRGDERIWVNARKELFQELRREYKPVDATRLPSNSSDVNSFLTLFSGFVSLADWIGSMTEFFPFLAEYLPLAEYSSRHAHPQALNALQNLGWTGWRAQGDLLTFSEMFSEIHTPNSIQQETFDALADIELPALVILEAPTGIGKTEAALFLADTWLQKQRGKGIYIAMPSQATSNQMYERVERFLGSRYPVDKLNFHLIHGAAALREEIASQPQGVAQDDVASEGGVKAESWFLPRKRTLLAPFGVGTVDQALLSVLQTNHFFVRLFGLAQKIVIFDEVHAYDTYMSTLFERLLHWLHSIGTSVILLSATLPEKTRQSFVNAWLGEEKAPHHQVGYPRLTTAFSGNVNIHPLSPPSSRTLHLEWIGSEPETLAEHLAEKLKEGGCAAVICNRVRRAQEVYQALQAKGIVEPENLILFHARFPFAWRDEIEKRVLSFFGKGKDRPRKAIVVATQVIEQSLDLDFDYMITDLAPIDLLLQRAGRLHRHSQNNLTRPINLGEPQLVIVRPEAVDGLPEFGADNYVYDRATLLCTWLTLQGLEQLILPEQTASLIEAVYGDTNLANLSVTFTEELIRARERGRMERAKDVHQANQRLINPPDDEDFIIRGNESLEEDNPKVNETFRALTRLGEPNVSIICLHQTNHGVALEPDGTGAPVETQHRPTKTQAISLLKRAVNVQHRDVVNYILSHDTRKADWKRSAAVREYFPIVFDEKGEYRPEDASFTLKLSREFGLEVLKKEAE